MNIALEAELRSRLWAIRHDALADVLAKCLDGRASIRPTSAPRMAGISGGQIAVIPLHGPIDQRSGPFTALLGGTGLDRFNQSLRNAAEDETVKQILIDVDSPGGNVYGIPEAAAAMATARQKKPVVAIANSLAASAAYWIASQADEIYITPGGEVGSIGVYTMHSDVSKAMDSLGVKTTLISAGKFKTEGNTWEPLDKDAKAFMQSRINQVYAAFTLAVARGRGVTVDMVRNGMGQGRCLGADQALSLKMVDGIATFDQVVRKMQTSAMQSRSPAFARSSHALSGITSKSMTPATREPSKRPCNGAVTVAHARRILALIESKN